MKIFLVGATGRTGRRFLDLAARAGHEVIAFSRGAPGLASRYENTSTVRLVAGDVLDGDQVKAFSAGSQAIVSVLGADNFREPGTLLSQGMKNLVAAAEANGIGRLVALAGAGILQLTPTSLRRERPGFPVVFQATSEEHLRAYDTLRGSRLDWTLVCTPELHDGEPTHNARALDDYLPEGGRFVSTGEVARFMLEELKQPRFVRRRVGLAV